MEKEPKEPTALQLFGAAFMVIMFVAAMTSLLYRLITLTN